MAYIFSQIKLVMHGNYLHGVSAWKWKYICIQVVPQLMQHRSIFLVCHRTSNAHGQSVFPIVIYMENIKEVITSQKHSTLDHITVRQYIVLNLVRDFLTFWGKNRRIVCEELQLLELWTNTYSCINLAHVRSYVHSINISRARCRFSKSSQLLLG